MFGRGGALLAALALAVTAMAAPAAQARVVKVTVEGQVATATGSAPLFGRPNAELAGLDYIAVFLFETTVGHRLKSPTFDSIFGGLVHQQPTPSLGARITINGVTLSLAGEALGTLSTANSGPFGTTIQNLRDINEFEGSHSVLYSEIRTSKPGSLGVSLEEPFTYQVDPLDRTTSHYDFQYAEQAGCCVAIRSAVGTLKPRSIRLETVGVPEPSTWAILVCGFGLAGAGLRRRRRVLCG